jgi:uncharacterized protein (TIGR00730 family)
MIRRLCVFCGSSMGVDPIHAEAARALGTALAQAGIGLVFGGGSIGLMGVLADAVLAAGGDVTGVIPQALVDRELAYHGCTTLHVTTSMHERKALMADLSEGFIALPGGIGTLEEMFEIWTWAQLGDHAKPVALLNVGGFYDPLIAFLHGVVAAGFLAPEHRALLVVASDIDELLARLAHHKPRAAPAWIAHDER